MLEQWVLESRVLEWHVEESGLVLETAVLEPVAGWNRWCLNRSARILAGAQTAPVAEDFVYDADVDQSRWR